MYYCWPLLIDVEAISVPRIMGCLRGIVTVRMSVVRHQITVFNHRLEPELIEPDAPPRASRGYAVSIIAADNGADQRHPRDVIRKRFRRQDLARGAGGPNPFVLPEPSHPHHSFHDRRTATIGVASRRAVSRRPQAPSTWITGIVYLALEERDSVLA